MNQEEIAEITSAAQTISWATMVESSLGGQSSGLRFSGVKSASLNEMWAALRNEVYELLCTTSSRYAPQRASFAITIKPAIAAIAALMTKDYGLPVAAASSLASLALLLPVRMVKDAWCSVASTPNIAVDEQKELQKLIREDAAHRKSRKS